MFSVIIPNEAGVWSEMINLLSTWSYDDISDRVDLHPSATVPQRSTRFSASDTLVVGKLSSPLNDIPSLMKRMRPAWNLDTCPIGIRLSDESILMDFQSLSDFQKAARCNFRLNDFKFSFICKPEVTGNSNEVALRFVKKMKSSPDFADTPEKTMHARSSTFSDHTQGSSESLARQVPIVSNRGKLTVSEAGPGAGEWIPICPGPNPTVVGLNDTHEWDKAQVLQAQNDTVSCEKGFQGRVGHLKIMRRSDSPTSAGFLDSDKAFDLAQLDLARCSTEATAHHLLQRDMILVDSQSFVPSAGELQRIMPQAIGVVGEATKTISAWRNDEMEDGPVGEKGITTSRARGECEINPSPSETSVNEMEENGEVVLSTISPVGPTMIPARNHNPEGNLLSLFTSLGMNTTGREDEVLEMATDIMVTPVKEKENPLTGIAISSQKTRLVKELYNLHSSINYEGRGTEC